MASIQRLPIASLGWTLEKTTTYNSGSPAATPGAWAVSAITFDAVALTFTGTLESALGALYTFTSPCAAFVGIRCHVTPTYVVSPNLELWTYNGSAWTQQIVQSLTVDQNEGVSSTKGRVFEFWLDTPAANVTKIWVTYSSTNVSNGGWGAIHLYQYADETTEDALEEGTDSPFTDDYDFRPRGALPADLAGKSFCLAYQLDRTPDPADDSVDADGAWSVLDLPAAACAQTTDPEGNDIIVLAINDLVSNTHHVVTLDWTRYQDEYYFDQTSPIYRRWSFGPIPFLPDNDNTETTPRYDLSTVKRFRQIECESQVAPTDATTALRVTAQEFGVASTARTQTYVTAKRNQMQIAVRGLQFQVLIEHAANEAWDPIWWRAFWDMLGPRIQQNEIR